MKADLFELTEEELATWLAAYDDGLAAGSPASTPPDVHIRLEKNLACLRRLRRVWPTSDSETLTTEPSQETAPDLSATRTRLGRFEIRRELGQGGYGIVFLAHDPQLGREVALKIPRPDTLVTPELRIRFHQEAQAAAGLDHPNVVSVYEAGEIGAICYIASAYCPGETLASWLRQRSDPIPFDEAAALVAALADGVQHAHSRGVLHRDLKPANILMSVVSCQLSVVREDAARRPLTTDNWQLTTIPKITDFGLAKLLEGNTKSLTQSGAIVGTPQYMAPEQARGSAQAMTTAVDVYARGAILYELLTGRPPFQAETALDTLHQVVFAEPVPPRRLRPSVPRDLETICLKCLHKQPERRYVSAAALAEDLRHFLNAEPVRARPVGTGERIALWTRRKPVIAGLAASLIVVFLSGSAVATWQWLRADRQRDLAEERRQKAHQAVNDYFRHVSENKLLGRPGMQGLRSDLLETALRYYQEFLRERGDDPAMQEEVADTYAKVADVYEDFGMFDDCRNALHEALSLRQKLLDADPGDEERQAKLARSYFDLALYHRNIGDYATAIGLHLDVRSRLETLIHANPGKAAYHSLLGDTYLDIGHMQSKTGPQAEVLLNFYRAKEITEQLVRTHPGVPRYERNLGSVWHNIGNELRKKGERDKALYAFEQSREWFLHLVRAHPGVPDYPPLLVNTYLKLGSFHASTNQPVEALRAYQQAVEVAERVVADNPLVPEFERMLAKSYASLGNHKRQTQQMTEAQRFEEQALEMREKIARLWPTLAEVDKDVAESYRDLGRLRFEIGDAADALRLYVKSRERFEKALQIDSKDHRCQGGLGTTWDGLALTFAKLGKPDEAIAAHREAIRLQSEAMAAAPELTQYREDLSNHYEHLARLHRQLKQPAEAVASSMDQQKLWPAQPARLVTVARDVALCIELVPAYHSAERDSYAQHAIEILQQAIRSGFTDVGQLANDPAFRPLKSVSGFQELLAEQRTNGLEE